MKNAMLLFALFASMLMVGCAATQDVVRDDTEQNRVRRFGDRVYVDDPFYGTVVLERDPFTGRYFDVTNGFGGWYSPYNRWGMRGGGWGPRVYRNGGTVQRPSQPAPKVDREEARRRILGN